MKRIFFVTLLGLFLSGCAWSSYEGCALWPTDTVPIYEYTGEKYYSPQVNVTQKWWEYKSGEFGFWPNQHAKGNAPWWAYPKDIVSTPIMVGTLFIMVLCGEEMP